MGPTPFNSPDLRRVCGLSGVQGKISSQKLVTLKELEKGLMHAIQEADAALNEEVFWTRALVAAKFVKATADLTIDLIDKLAPPPAQFATKSISMVYDRASLVVDALNGSLEGGHVGKQIVDTHLDVAEEVVKSVGKETAAKTLGYGRTLVKACAGVQDVYQAYKSLHSAGSGTYGARQTLLAQLHKVQRQIVEVERSFAACGLY